MESKTQQTEMIPRDQWVSLNTLKIWGPDKCKGHIHDMFIEYIESSPSDEKREGTLIYITLLQLFDAMQIEACKEESEEEIAKLKGELNKIMDLSQTILDNSQPKAA